MTNWPLSSVGIRCGTSICWNYLSSRRRDKSQWLALRRQRVLPGSFVATAAPSPRLIRRRKGQPCSSNGIGLGTGTLGPMGSRSPGQGSALPSASLPGHVTTGRCNETLSRGSPLAGHPATTQPIRAIDVQLDIAPCSLHACLAAPSLLSARGWAGCFVHCLWWTGVAVNVLGLSPG